MESVLAELFYTGKSIRIVTEEVVIEADFGHALDEDGFTLDEPHPLVAVIKIRFDSSGKEHHVWLRASQITSGHGRNS